MHDLAGKGSVIQTAMVRCGTSDCRTEKESCSNENG